MLKAIRNPRHSRGVSLAKKTEPAADTAGSVWAKNYTRLFTPLSFLQGGSGNAIVGIAPGVGAENFLLA